LDLFKKTIERNKRSKGIAKNKIIKLPFLAFMSGEEADVEWEVKEVEQEEKKKGKRSQIREMEKKEEEQVVKVRFGRGVPDSYGDLDLFRLLQESEMGSTVLKERESVNVKGVVNEEMEFEYGIEYREDGMNLIDEVLGEERSSE
jgi:stalled ribosome alternative rescue factor ArfA